MGGIPLTDNILDNRLFKMLNLIEISQEEEIQLRMFGASIRLLNSVIMSYSTQKLQPNNQEAI